MARAAYLRMYLPAEQVGYFPEHVPAARGRRVLTRGTFGVWGETPRNDAFITTYRARRYVCPRFPRFRMLEGLIAFRAAYPESASSALVPDSMADAVERELDRLRASGPVRSHILTSPWHVPLRWFAAFTPDEREIIDGGAPGISIRYRTLQGDALRRLRRVTEVLEEAGFEDGVVEQLADLVAWMSGFPPDAMVELDYAGVADLFPEADLVLDESAAEIEVCLDALEEGDLERAGEAYASVASRWSHARSIAHFN